MAQSQRSQALSVGAVSPSEPARAGLSSQAGTKTVVFPEAVHAPMDTEQQAGHFSRINLFRVSCLCGYRGCWYSAESFAMDAHLRHAARNLGGVR